MSGAATRRQELRGNLPAVPRCGSDLRADAAGARAFLTITARFVFRTEAPTSGQSNGTRLRGSITSALTPSFASSSAAS